MNVLNMVKQAVAAALLIEEEAEPEALAKAVPITGSGHRSIYLFFKLSIAP